MSATRPRRSVHFVPGGNDRFFEKGLAGGADTLVLDLEDSVVPDQKLDARRAVAGWLSDEPRTGRRDDQQPRHELMVRINALDTEWWRDDVAVVVAAGARSLMVPKVSSADELDQLAAAVDEVDPTGAVAFFPVATETARAVFHVAELAGHARVDGLCWGAEDLSADLGASAARLDGRLLDVFVTVRSLCLLGARAGGVGAVDAVWTDLDDHDGLRREATEAAAMGFDGKITIHPAQIEIVNEAFTPAAADVEAARELISAFEEHAAEGRRSFRFRGAMVDAPHLARAQRLLTRAVTDQG